MCPPDRFGLVTQNVAEPARVALFLSDEAGNSFGKIGVPDLVSMLYFGTGEELTSPARPNFTTNRPRRRCLSDEHGLVALGLAARQNVGA